MRQNWTIWTNYSLKSRWLEGPKVAPKLLPNEEEPCYSMSNCSKKCARTPIYLLLLVYMAVMAKTVRDFSSHRWSSPVALGCMGGR